MSAPPSQRVEYQIVNGRVSIVGDDGAYLPAYWAHPDMVGRFPALVVLHDWWGVTPAEQHIAERFAQLGYYTLIPDLFDGAVADTPEAAYRLVQARGRRRSRTIDTAFTAIEHHIRTNGRTAVVGLGLGGSLAFEAALTRRDLEAAVSVYGFPQRFFGRFKDARVPLLALYGSDEPHVPRDAVEQLRRELGESSLAHEVVILDGAGRGFLDPANPFAPQAWAALLAFLEKHQVSPRK